VLFVSAVTVKLDAFVTSESTHAELCKALKVSSFPNSKLRLIIGRLAMMCLGQARIALLLKQLQPQVRMLCWICNWKPKHIHSVVE
jgi:hypothetical protein